MLSNLEPGETANFEPTGDATNLAAAPPESDNEQADVPESDNEQADVAVATPEDSELEDNGEIVYGAMDGENIESAGERLIPMSSIWKSKDHLKEVCSKYGLSFGFTVCSHG